MSYPAYVRIGTYRGRNRDININVQLSIPTKSLLNITPLKILHDKKYGLVGRNGVGKSMLMKYIHNRDDPFIDIPDYISTYMVEQEISNDERTPLQIVLESHIEREWLLKTQNHLINNDTETEYDYSIDDIETRLREIESYKAEARATTILLGLGFNIKDIINKKALEFSGGWRMRISLACGLFQEPDLLILDEPTNFLDIPAVIWLEDYLTKYKKGLLLASHDVEFLNSTVNKIIHFHNETLTYYKGNYDTFIKTKDLNTIIPNKKKKKKPIIIIPKEEPVPNISFPIPSKMPETAVIKIQNVSFSYDDNPMFSNLEFGIYMNSRIGLIGSNGTGKSTIMKLIRGKLKEKTGYIWRDDNLRISYFNQHHVDKFDDFELTPLQYFMNKSNSSSEHDIRCYLAKFGIKNKQSLQKISTLSGGQKSRLALADIAYNDPHILLLDEPNSHLDIDTSKSLIKGLKDFKGAIVLISHDQHIIESIVDELWILEHNDTEYSLEKFDGTFLDYKNEILNCI